MKLVNNNRNDALNIFSNVGIAAAVLSRRPAAGDKCAFGANWRVGDV